MVRIPAAHVVLVAFGLLAGSCGASDDQAVAVRFAGTGAPVAAAVVTPMIQGPAGVPPTLDPNADTAATDGEGRFLLSYDELASDLAVKVTIDVPSTVGPAVGQFDFIGPHGESFGDLTIVEPIPCVPSLECGVPQLPDLTPIIGWSDLDDAVVARLQPSSEGPPTAGLLPEETWFISEEGGQRLLRFATVAANVGDGPLDVIAAPNAGERAQTWQRIWTDTWHFSDVVAGEFISHEGHDHIHFDAFERYRLLDEDGAVVASSEKVSFCLRDSVLLEASFPVVEGPLLFDNGDCEGQQQVINAGFGDHYHALLDDQWIDISGVPAGQYLVEVAVDPLNLIRESDEQNNVGTFEVVLD